jgi:hypothetical protein
MARVGFDYATLETEFASDPKFQKLRRIAQGNQIAYLAATGAWLTIVAEAWHSAERFSGTEAAANLPPELIEMLRRADLLDDASCISESAFEQWIGRALERRKDVAARVARHRERKARVTATQGARRGAPETVTSSPSEHETGVGGPHVTHRDSDSEGEGAPSIREGGENGRDEVSVPGGAWLSTLRDLYGPGGVFEGKTLPGQWKGRTWSEVEAGLAS